MMIMNLTSADTPPENIGQVLVAFDEIGNESFVSGYYTAGKYYTDEGDLIHDVIGWADAPNFNLI